MIGAIALTNPFVDIREEQVYLVKYCSSDISNIKYYNVYSLDNTYIGIYRKDWFILESIYLGRLREQQINSIFS
jgi:hypothetical protein